MKDPKAILITGASSGLGLALARAYAAPGKILTLVGRDRPRLEDIAATCRLLGAEAWIAEADVADRAAMADVIRAAEARHPLDLVIANAGISMGTHKRGSQGPETEADTRRVFAVNLEGVLNTILPVLPLMRGRRRGQIGLMSSLAGFRGLPDSPAYSASKAAVRVLAESLRNQAKESGVEISAICPGFIRTPMTDANRIPMPFMLEPDRAAAIVKAGLAADKSRIAFPWQLHLIVWLLAALPPAWTDPFLKPHRD